MGMVPATRLRPRAYWALAWGIVEQLCIQLFGLSYWGYSGTVLLHAMAS